jgi:membrane-associated phospholipid phosphatase
MPDPSYRRWRPLVVLLSALGLIAFAIAFVDRPASTWSYAHHLRRFPIFNDLTHLVDPLEPGALLGLVAAGLAVGLRGWKPGEKGLTFVAACLTVVVAYAIKEQLKFIFGRTWPETWVDHNPSWITDGAYGFHFFHGGEGWASFPSGHTTEMAALASVLWIRIRRWRWVWASLVLLVVVGLLGADYHFVGDMIAGGCLGAVCAAGVVAFLQAMRSAGPPS